MHTKKIILLIFAALLGFLAGYSLGIYQSLNYLVDVLIKYAEYNNITLDLSEAALREYAFTFMSSR